MAGRKGVVIGVAAAGLAVLWWVTLPPDEVAFDRQCRPNPGPASLAAKLHPDAFWEAQLAAAIAERDLLLARPAKRERIAEQERREQTSTIEQQMSRLSRAEDGASRDERQLREAAEQRKRMERLVWLMDCENQIGVLLGR